MPAPCRPTSSGAREEALDGKARLGLGLLAFQAVGREGLETMVFTLAIVSPRRTRRATARTARRCSRRRSPGSPSPSRIAYVDLRSSAARLNLGLFFRVIGVVLMVFAAGLLADAVENMQELGWLPFGGHVLWDIDLVPERGQLASATSSTACWATPTGPSVLQAACGSATWPCTVTLFVRMGRRRSAPAAPPAAGAGDAPPVATGAGPAPVAPVAPHMASRINGNNLGASHQSPG